MEEGIRKTGERVSVRNHPYGSDWPVFDNDVAENNTANIMIYHCRELEIRAKVSFSQELCTLSFYGGSL